MNVETKGGGAGEGETHAVVTLREWEQRKEFVSFTDQDAKLLQQLRHVAEAYVEEVVNDLYRQLERTPETKAFFPDLETLDRVKALQREYFLALTAGEYGEAYLMNRLHIGRVHQRIGLSPRWYMGAYSIYMQSVMPRIMKAFASDQTQMIRTLMALFKIFNLDQELALTTYIAAAEEMITRQSREIMEMSTPVMRIWEGVVVAPLIGTLDSERTQLLMERLLPAIVETGSTIALVDITGVPTIDTNTAQHLIETMRAVKLLGSTMVLTGIRPAIARTLVHLGIDLSGIVTHPSLAAGLRVSLEALNSEAANKKGLGQGKEA